MIKAIFTVSENIFKLEPVLVFPPNHINSINQLILRIVKLHPSWYYVDDYSAWHKQVVGPKKEKLETQKMYEVMYFRTESQSKPVHLLVEYDQYDRNYD